MRLPHTCVEPCFLLIEKRDDAGMIGLHRYAITFCYPQDSAKTQKTDGLLSVSPMPLSRPKRRRFQIPTMVG